MSLTALPLEVLEILLLYFGTTDLINILDVLSLDGSKFFWKEVCKRQGFKGEEKCWKTVFQRNVNWFTQKFIKREYFFNESKESFRPTYSVHGNNLGTRGVLHGSNILLKSNNDEVYVWNIENSPKFVQSFDTQFVRAGGTKLITQSSAETVIYKSGPSSYHKLKSISNISLNFYCDICLTDDFFAAFMHDLTSIRVINLNSLEDFIISLAATKVGPISKLVVSGKTLYVLLTEDSKYVLKRFYLESRVWSSDLVLLHGAALLSFPQLRISSKFIVSWSSLLEYAGITPLKVWNTNGDFNVSLSMEFIRSFGTQTFNNDTILWMILEEDYIIFSISETSVSIWTSQNPEVCRELPIERFSLGQQVVSSSFLILSYSHCFKAVDFKKPVHLYEVLFDYHDLDTLHLNQFSFVNDYFYVTITKNDLTIDASKVKGKELSSSRVTCQLPKDDSYALNIYDFRGNLKIS